jgi:2-polyprenyl-3-methyl-5-hydroxy-6-metoxy-1,4-benzoquinol methylase
MAVNIDPHHRERDALARLGVTFADASVLEIGCGDGRLTRSYAAAARAVVAIDPDRQAIADARSSAVWPGHVEFVEGAIEGVRASREPFDVVLFAWSL